MHDTHTTTHTPATSTRQPARGRSWTRPARRPSGRPPPWWRFGQAECREAPPLLDVVRASAGGSSSSSQSNSAARWRFANLANVDRRVCVCVWLCEEKWHAHADTRERLIYVKSPFAFAKRSAHTHSHNGDLSTLALILYIAGHGGAAGRVGVDRAGWHGAFVVFFWFGSRHCVVFRRCNASIALLTP